MSPSSLEEPMYITELQSLFVGKPMYINMQHSGSCFDPAPGLLLSAAAAAQEQPRWQCERLESLDGSYASSSSRSSDPRPGCITPKRKKQSVGGKKQPKLLWCEGSMERGKHMQDLAHRFCQGKYSHFRSAANFTRWLFLQGTRTVEEPRAVLVVGWREAKPCGSGLRSLFTGDTEGLRSDSKRPELETAAQACLVKAVIVLTDSEKHYRRAKEWTEGELLLSSHLELLVARDATQLMCIVERLFSEG
eukprot:TRINITY_DN75459_c0_g1_i1.p1 TRINITY_DN75459_c0_g1~~TRINITY_DN75459_c0_g1_i1.p1  ORF type:complete len:248 (+),score=55.57 TRINITY_DN75459_c0_g1_i1:72-815(+)